MKRFFADTGEQTACNGNKSGEPVALDFHLEALSRPGVGRMALSRQKAVVLTEIRAQG